MIPRVKGFGWSTGDNEVTAYHMRMFETNLQRAVDGTGGTYWLQSDLNITDGAFRATNLEVSRLAACASAIEVKSISGDYRIVLNVPTYPYAPLSFNSTSAGLCKRTSFVSMTSSNGEVLDTAKDTYFVTNNTASGTVLVLATIYTTGDNTVHGAPARNPVSGEKITVTVPSSSGGAINIIYNTSSIAAASLDTIGTSVCWAEYMYVGNSWRRTRFGGNL